MNFEWLKNKDEQRFYPVAHTDGVLCGENSDEVLSDILDNKVDKIDGKTLSTNDLTNELKTNYDEAYSNMHTHSNKTIIDSLSKSSEGKLLYEGEEVNLTLGSDGLTVGEIKESVDEVKETLGELFSDSPNRLNKEDIALGKTLLANSDNTAVNSALDTTTYLKVNSGTTYTISNARFLNVYTGETPQTRKLSRSLQESDGGKITVDLTENENWIRFTLYHKDYDTVQYVEGNELPDYSPCGVKLENEEKVHNFISKTEVFKKVNEISDELVKFAETGKKDITNDITYSGHCILADQIIYKTDYVMTEALHFDKPTELMIKGTSPRYAKLSDDTFNSIVETNTSLKSDVYITFTCEPDYYYRFSFPKDTEKEVAIKYSFVMTDDLKKLDLKNLKGKTVYNFGDSLMYGHLSGEGILDGLCKENEMILTKYAINGAMVLGGSGGYNIENQVTGASSVVPDYVIFDGLMNDDTITPNYTTNLGELSESYVATDLDTSTFYGAFEHLLYAIRNKYMNTNIIFVCCHRTPTRNKNAQEVLQKACRECCEKWSIPYVDIYNKGQINCYFTPMADAYSVDGYESGSNGTHLSGEGYNKWYAPMIKAKMIEVLSD